MSKVMSRLSQCISCIFPGVVLLQRACQPTSTKCIASSTSSLDIAREAALRKRPFAMHLATVLVLCWALQEVLGRHEILSYCTIRFGSPSASVSNLINDLAYEETMWEAYPISCFLSLVIMWYALWHAYVRSTVCLKQGNISALFTLENIALFTFMLFEYTADVLWYCVRGRGIKLKGLMYLFYKLVYLLNTNLLIGVTTSYQAVAAHPSRTVTCWLIWLVHCSWTIGWIAVFLQCGSMATQVFTRELGLIATTILMGGAHFSDTHRFVMLVGVLLGLHTQQSLHDPPNILHFFEVFKRPCALLCAIGFVLLNFGITLICELVAVARHRVGEERTFIAVWISFLFLPLSALAVTSYYSQSYKSTRTSWETILTMISSTAAMPHFLHFSETRPLIGLSQTCGFFIMAAFACDVFSSRITLSATASLLPLFVSLAMVMDCTVVEFSALAASHDSTTDDPDGFTSTWSHIVMHTAEFMLNEFALITTIGWLDHFLETSESLHSHAHGEAEPTSVDAWRQRRRRQTQWLRQDASKHTVKLESCNSRSHDIEMSALRDSEPSTNTSREFVPDGVWH